MMGMTRVGFGSATMVALLGLGLVAGCTGQVQGEARPDPAVTVATGSPSSTRSSSPTTNTRSSSPTTSTRSSSPSASSSGAGHLLLCDGLPSVANSTTKSINDFLAVFNSSQGAPTPELVAAEQKVLAALAPVPTQLRTLPGLRILPPSDSLAREVPALASAVEAVAAAIPQRKSAPFNDAKTGYNTHLDALKVLCP